MKAYVKPILIALYLASGGAAVAERAGALGPTPGLLLYAGLFALLALALLATAWIRPAAVRLVHGLVLAVAAGFLGAYAAVSGDFLHYDAFLTMVGSTDSSADALVQHWRPIAGGIAPAILLFAAIAWPPPRPARLPQPLLIGAAPLAVALLAGIFYLRGGDGGRGLPAPFPPLAYAALSAWERAADDVGPRKAVSMRPAALDQRRDIVLIVDESVAGHYLDINHPGGARSGLADPPPGISIYNYGLAASITHCSLGTNQTLRYGGTREDYRRINAVMPSIWDYARKAGYHTARIDAQLNGGARGSATMAGELDGIGTLHQPGDTPVRDRDMAAADRIAELTRNGRADFVIVTKVGAHFPVHDKYPDAFMRYHPALPRGRFLDISDTGSRAGFGGSPQEWRQYRNAYRNTLEWNVGAFFDRLFAKADLDAAIILYTADHGQDLHEDGRPGFTTHCTPAPQPSEGAVPLVVIDPSSGIGWVRNLAANRNRASHYNIFPTLLALMGYKEGDVAPVYGRSLLQKTQDDLTFNARFHARLGKEPVWVPIDPARLPSPDPAADAAR
ncbi:MAG: sulfatase-like hydrolase/transferase [Allosphingosinicella sp.]